MNTRPLLLCALLALPASAPAATIDVSMSTIINTFADHYEWLDFTYYPETGWDPAGGGGNNRDTGGWFFLTPDVGDNCPSYITLNIKYTVEARIGKRNATTSGGEVLYPYMDVFVGAPGLGSASLRMVEPGTYVWHVPMALVPDVEYSIGFDNSKHVGLVPPELFAIDPTNGATVQYYGIASGIVTGYSLSTECVPETGSTLAMFGGVVGLMGVARRMTRKGA